MPDDLLAQVESAGLQWLAVSAPHTWRTQDVVLPHRDPLDRILLAQAWVEGLTLLTADRVVLDAGMTEVVRLDAAR